MVYPSGQKSLFIILKLITKQKCETFPFLNEKVDRILPLFGIIDFGSKFQLHFCKLSQPENAKLKKKPE